MNVETMTREEMEREAAKRIRNARSDLIMTRKFYAVLIAQVDPVVSWKVPTMATDSVRHYFNPRFICGLSPEEVEGTQGHESEHDARHHSTRRKGRDPKLWNMACDYAINGDLLAEGFVLPKGALYRKEFVGMPAEEIYRVLLIEQQQKQQQQQQQQEQEGEEDDESEAQGGSGQAGDADGESETDESTSEQEDESEAEDDTGTGQGAGDETEDESESETDGGSQSSDTGDEEAGEPEAGDESDGGKGKAADENVKSCGDEGGCGEVLDAPGTEAEQADLDARWEVVTRQAAAIAKRKGDLPGHWAEEIEKRHTPTQDWKNVLREYIDATVAKLQTWNRPNRRFVHAGILLPGYQKDGVNKVAFIIDASGSMSGQHVKVANELQAALDDGSISEVILIYCDTEVYHVDRFSDGEKIELAKIRLGGTDMRPAFQWIADNDPDASLIVCLTDLFIGDPGEEPASPVLWCAYGDPRTIQTEGALLPWGKVLDVDAD